MIKLFVKFVLISVRCAGDKDKELLQSGNSKGTKNTHLF